MCVNQQKQLDRKGIKPPQQRRICVSPPCYAYWTLPCRRVIPKFIISTKDQPRTRSARISVTCQSSLRQDSSLRTSFKPKRPEVRPVCSMVTLSTHHHFVVYGPLTDTNLFLYIPDPDRPGTNGKPSPVLSLMRCSVRGCALTL